MSRRTLTATAAAIAAAVALAPGPAYAAAPAQSATRGVSAESPAPITPKPSALRSFHSPASAALRVQRPALAGTGPAARSAANSAVAADAANVIYAATGGYSCSPVPGNGTEAHPYCSVQDAVNAAAPGDTIDVFGETGYSSQQPVTVTTSNLSIVGIGGQAWINTGSATPALTLDGVTGVTVSNLMLTSDGGPTVTVTGSSKVTLDSDYVVQQPGADQPVDTVSIDGTSSGITVSRTYLDTGGWTAGANAVSAAPGASNLVLASDVLADAGITATGVDGLDVTGDTIQRGCSSGIDIEGASTGVSLENNLLEDAVPGVDSDGYLNLCTAYGQPWAPDVTVAADAAGGTTADYNDFYVYNDDATAPYSWAGTSYPTLNAFRSGVLQGGHDSNDTIQPGETSFRAGQGTNVNASLQPRSAAIDSADPNAPGALQSDFYGSSPYTSRGAVQYLSLNPTLSMSLSGSQTSAYGLALTAAVTSAKVPLSVTVDWGDGVRTYDSAPGPGAVKETHEYSQLGEYNVTFTVYDSTGDAVSNTTKVWTAGSDYTAYGPARILDTRSGLGAPEAKVPSHGTVHLRLVGSGGVPAAASAAVLNVTVTDATASGYITVYDDDSARPGTSNVNFNKGQTVPNQVIALIGADGSVALYNGSGGTVDLIADIAGYFSQAASSGYTPLSPYRVVDTRNGTGTAKGQVHGAASFATQIAGADNGLLPGSGITAVALNVTSTGSRAGGYLTVYPDGGTRPGTSSVNFDKGQTIANSVIVPVAADGRIRFYNGSGASGDVVADVVGYYSADSRSAYMPMEPTRYLDTRSKSWGHGQLANGDNYIYMPVSADYPGITGFVLNATVTDTKGPGYLTVSPDPNQLNAYQNGWQTFPTKPFTSALNWTRGQTVPNLVQASTGNNGIIDFWNTSGSGVDLVVDAFGYYEYG